MNPAEILRYFSVFHKANQIYKVHICMAVSVYIFSWRTFVNTSSTEMFFDAGPQNNPSNTLIV